MTKKNLIKARTTFESCGIKNISVMTDENVKFSSLDSFLLWDDTNDMLVIITANQEPAAKKSNRAEVVMVDYDSIVYISSFPDVTKIDQWLPKVTDGLTADIDRIKQSFRQVTDEKYFL